MPLGVLLGIQTQGLAPPPFNQLLKTCDLWLSQSGRIWGCLPSPGFLEGRETASDLVCARGSTRIATCAQVFNYTNSVTAFCLQNIKTLHIKLKFLWSPPTHLYFCLFSGRFQCSLSSWKKKVLYIYFFHFQNTISSLISLRIFLKVNIRFHLFVNFLFFNYS